MSLKVGPFFALTLSTERKLSSFNGEYEMKLASLALLSALIAVPAVAEPIYINIGTNFGGNANKHAGPTTTGLLDELQFNYTSYSTVFDSSNDGLLGVGDTITSTGGLKGTGFNFNTLTDGYLKNSITSLLPQAAGPFGPSDNGFKTNWFLSFGFDNLVGTLVSGGGVQWLSGTISFYATTDINTCFGANDSSCFKRLFDMNVTTGGNIPSGTVLTGNVQNYNYNVADKFNSVFAGDVFNFAGNTFKGQGASFRVDQNVTDLPAATAWNPVTKTWTLASAEHRGGISFATAKVSEPTTLAVLGLGLMGLFYRRRSQKA